MWKILENVFNIKDNLLKKVKHKNRIFSISRGQDDRVKKKKNGIYIFPKGQDEFCSEFSFYIKNQCFHFLSGEPAWILHF